jgi:hypothetical protein
MLLGNRSRARRKEKKRRGKQGRCKLTLFGGHIVLLLCCPYIE